VTGRALAMRLQVASLRQRWGVPPETAEPLPLAPWSPGDMILEGICAAPSVDRERQKLRPHCLSWLPWKLPPLLYRHRNDERAGEILSLAYDDTGCLRIRARVSHDEAKRCMAFSAGLTVRDFEIRGASTPEFAATVLQGWLEEVSCTRSPCNADCIVTSRYPAPAVTTFFELMQKRVALVGQMVDVMREEIRA
jgi:hypothetical protein